MVILPRKVAWGTAVHLLVSGGAVAALVEAVYLGWRTHLILSTGMLLKRDFGLQSGG